MKKLDVTMKNYTVKSEEENTLFYQSGVRTKSVMIKGN